MSTRIDLEDLERKAVATPFGEPPASIDDSALTIQAAGYHDFATIESMVCELRHRRSKQAVIDAVPVLIAYIREMEAALGGALNGWRFAEEIATGYGNVAGPGTARRIEAAQALLAKGAVLP